MTDLSALHGVRELIEAAPSDDLPELLGELERLKAVAWARLTIPTSLRTSTSEDADQTAGDLAKVFGVPRSFFYELARRHEVPHNRLGRYVRFNRAEVERWVADNSKSATLSIRKKRHRGNGLRGAATTLQPAKGVEP